MITPAIRERWETAAAGKADTIVAAATRFADLLKLMADLHGPQGCPWDHEQTLASLRQYVREEAEEICHAVDAILAYEDQLRAEAGMPLADPAPPGAEDRARTETKGLTIGHHPHRGDFNATASASGAPLPATLSPAEREALDRLYHELTAEMGDFLLQAAFLGDILLDMGRPGLDASLEAILAKLIRRHPHVYGGLAVEDSAEVLRNWEHIKRAERGG
jgi:NTP pyrophosphatase (non-canonical NTP hydrolase)